MEIAFTDRELDLMDILWDLGSATVPEMLEQLDGEPAYTTISTLLRILVDKGHVGIKEEGRSHRYYPLVDRKAAGVSAFRRLTAKMFKGSTELALTHLVTSGSLTNEQIKRVQDLLKRQRKSEGR